MKKEKIPEESKLFEGKAMICTCGHSKELHFSGEGACGKCACTWLHLEEVKE